MTKVHNFNQNSQFKHKFNSTDSEDNQYNTDNN